MTAPERPLAGRSVCIVGINYSPESTGIAPFNTAMAHALYAAGAEVEVVTGFPHYPDWVVSPGYRRHLRRTEIDHGVTVRRRRHWVPARAGLIGRVAMEGTFALHVAPTVWRSKAEVVVAVTPSFGGVVGAELGRRGRPMGILVQDLSGNAAGESGTAGKRFSGRLAQVEYGSLRRATRIGVIAQRFAAILRQHGVPEAKVELLSNFSAIEPYPGTRDEARVELGWTTDRYLVVHAGNMGRKQGLDTVVEAARLADQQDLPVEFVLIGDGAVRRQLVEQAQGVERIRFLPSVPGTEIPRPLAAADALLVIEKPGVLEMSLPSKLTSYALAERPVIAAVTAGGITHSDLVESEMAELVAPGDPGALLDSIERLRASPKRQAELVAAGRRAAEDRYDRTAAERRYVDFVGRLLHSPNDPA